MLSEGSIRGSIELFTKGAWSSQTLSHTCGLRYEFRNSIPLEEFMVPWVNPQGIELNAGHLNTTVIYFVILRTS